MYICLPHRSVDSLILKDRLCKCNILPSHHQVFYQKNIIIVKKLYYNTVYEPYLSYFSIKVKKALKHRGFLTHYTLFRPNFCTKTTLFRPNFRTKTTLFRPNFRTKTTLFRPNFHTKTTLFRPNLLFIVQINAHTKPLYLLL